MQLGTELGVQVMQVAELGPRSSHRPRREGLSHGFRQVSNAFGFVKVQMTIQTPALRTLANLVTGDDQQTDIALSLKPFDAMKTLPHGMENGSLSHLRIRCRSTKTKIRQECCWMISNVCAGPLHQISQAIRASVMIRGRFYLTGFKFVEGGK